MYVLVKYIDIDIDILVWWLVTLHLAAGLKLDDHCGPFQPKPFMILLNQMAKK